MLVSLNFTNNETSAASPEDKTKLVPHKIILDTNWQKPKID